MSQAADFPTLRRIALLAQRVREDEPALRHPMDEISMTLDRIRRDAARGIPFANRDIERLQRLVRIVSRGEMARSPLHASMLDELRDLATALRAD